MSLLKVRFFGRRRDAGGVAVIVGILLATGVLLGASAIVVDVGQLYVEREQLQSGADAAAMAVALDCVHVRETACKDLAATTAKSYANLNARDHLSKIDEVCGEDRLGWLPTCSDDPANLTACLGQNPVNTSGWVKVRTSTERSGSGDSRFILPPVFAQTLAGHVSGVSVRACARVAWGTPPTTFAFTVCENIFNEYTENGTSFAPAPPSTSVSRYEHRFIQRPGTYTGFCDESRGPGTWPLNSDFGWEDRSFGDVNCNVDMSTPSDNTQLLPDEPPYTPDTCYQGLVDARNSRQPIPVLVVRPTGGIWVEVVGTAAFVVTGYRIQSRASARSWVRPFRRECPSDPAVCVIGYFTTQLVSSEQVLYRDTSIYGAFGAAPSLGASVVQTVG